MQFKIQHFSSVFARIAQFDKKTRKTFCLHTTQSIISVYNWFKKYLRTYLFLWRSNQTVQ